MWERSRTRQLLVGLVALKVLGLVLLFDWSQRAVDVFDLPKSLFSRSVEWVIAGVLIVTALRWGPAIIPRSRIHFVVLLMVVVYVVTSITGEDRYIAAFGARGRYLGLTFLVDMVVLYLAVAVSFRGVRDWAVLAIVTSVALIASGAYAWAQFLRVDPLAWRDASQGRPFSTIGNNNTYGHFLSVVLGLTVGTVILYRGSHALLVRAIAAALAIAVISTATVVASRGTALAIVVVALLVPTLALHQFGHTRRNVAISAVGLAGAGAMIALIVLATPLGARLQATLQGIDTRDRILIYQGSLAAFSERPLLGFGPDNLGVAWPRFRPAEMAALLLGQDISNNSAHDWALQAAATTGLIGLIASCLLVGVTFVSLARSTISRRPGTVPSLLMLVAGGYWAHALVSVGTAGVDWVPWFVLGGAVGLSGSGGAGRAGQRVAPLLLVVLGGVVVVGSLSGVRAFQANREAFAARSASDRRQGDVAVPNALAAISLDDGRADYWNELGRAYYVSASWAKAVTAFEGSVRRAPWDSTYRSNLARSLTQLALAGDGSKGGADSAISVARDAVETDPNNPSPRVALAEIASALGKPESALDAIVGALRLYKGDPRYDSIAASAANRATDLNAARRALDEALSFKESAVLRVALGNVALRQGDRAAALTNAKRALQLEPNNAEARALLQAAS